MTIVQIGKMIQRSGNIGDLLPGVLSEAELGFASDANRMFVGSAGGGNVVEVLTSYSNISFGQLTGASGIGLSVTAALDGQVLSYDAASGNWVNKGSTGGGRINLGNVGNVRITDGAIGYILETDGTGNLSWTSKGTITAPIRAISAGIPGIMTVDPKIPYVNFNEITISGVLGTNADAIVNGQRFFIKVAVNYPTTGNVELYQDALCTIPVDTTTLVATPLTGQAVSRVGSLANFAGGTNGMMQFNNGGILDGAPGFNYNPITQSIAVSGNVDAGNFNGNFSGNFVAPGANTQVIYNNAGVFGSDAGMTYNRVTDALTVAGNITGGNLIAVGELSTDTANITTSLIVSGTSNLGLVSNVTITGGTIGQALVTDGAGTLSWAVPTAGLLANPANTTGMDPATGTIYGTWTLAVGASISAKYADVAEAYESDKKYPPGTVVAIAGSSKVTQATKQMRYKLAGVISSNPAYVLNSLAPDSVLVALIGRVPCRVVGEIRKGDLLTISEIPGVACAANIPPEYATIIGRALEDYSGNEPGIIEIKVDRG